MILGTTQKGLDLALRDGIPGSRAGRLYGYGYGFGRMRVRVRAGLEREREVGVFRSVGQVRAWMKACCWVR